MQRRPKNKPFYLDNYIIKENGQYYKVWVIRKNNETFMTKSKYSPWQFEIQYNLNNPADVVKKIDRGLLFCLENLCKAETDDEILRYVRQLIAQMQAYQKQYLIKTNPNLNEEDLEKLFFAKIEKVSSLFDEKHPDLDLMVALEKALDHELIKNNQLLNKVLYGFIASKQEKGME